MFLDLYPSQGGVELLQCTCTPTVFAGDTSKCKHWPDESLDLYVQCHTCT